MKTEQNQNAEKLIELLKDSTICMFITYAENLSGRPMGVNRIDADGTMWFFAKVLSHKVYEIEENKKVSVVVVNEKTNTYLMINGEASVSYDETKMSELWSPEMTSWFPGGIDDPDMILIKVTPSEVSYWDNSSNRMLMLFTLHTKKELTPVINMMDVCTENNYRYRVNYSN